ncbi:hypothetical protein NIE88_17730 [Sporolactobacillus shoreicorticis]|uniref:Uncharacterized protein n=1 Tax=Sporolactobacillus shoreicorticis TaxID=1923877 RepID=A0ABW5RYV6_9BACL|nr:hypothetical protein [Sporolactobacillus shoreicorticis]MCO7127587.1 hypothetical protein [Sporolactobacillus shoreicorticis]
MSCGNPAIGCAYRTGPAKRRSSGSSHHLEHIIKEKIHELQEKEKNLIEVVIESRDPSLSRLTEKKQGDSEYLSSFSCM